MEKDNWVVWESWDIKIKGKKEDREEVINDIQKVLENSKLEDFVFEESK